MRARYRREINHDTRRPPIGEKREEKAEQLLRLRQLLLDNHAERHDVFLRALAHPYEDLSSFFAEVDELSKPKAPVDYEKFVIEHAASAFRSMDATPPQDPDRFRLCDNPGCNEYGIGYGAYGSWTCSLACNDAVGESRERADAEACKAGIHPWEGPEQRCKSCGKTPEELAAPRYKPESDRSLERRLLKLGLAIDRTTLYGASLDAFASQFGIYRGKVDQ